MALDVFAFVDGQSTATHERARLALCEILNNRDCLIERQFGPRAEPEAGLGLDGGDQGICAGI